MENEGEKELTEKPEEEDDDDGPPPGWQQPIPPPASTAPPPPPSEMAQMVCGSCRRLLTHPQGAKHVKCSCCQTINFVLEAHQVGQVKCASCAALLMYPYGTPLVRCSSCHVVTEIGDHNRRPPWSVQQAQPTPPSKVR
ncbi:protein LOL2 isoform X2 [Pistacia vera]|uniref:protein LOL2 isoform X2 n=1 Tax=Pistacia vera TaxID=55513 RepID=UPI001263C1B9|nr:protein LOL2 isoform X2 [Pistacia vera]